MTQQNGEQVVFPISGNQTRYDLAGEGLQIQITSTRIDVSIAIPVLSLSYQGPDGNGTFSRNDIRSLESEVGTLHNEAFFTHPDSH